MEFLICTAPNALSLRQILTRNPWSLDGTENEKKSHFVLRKNHKSKNVKIAADEIYNEFYQAYIETQKLKKKEPMMLNMRSGA